MSGTGAVPEADNLRIWRRVERTDPQFTKPFDNGTFKGTAVDAVYNVRRLTECLGPVGIAWGWRVVNEHVDRYGSGEDEQSIHTLLLRVWFAQPDGSVREVDGFGHTKVAYWTRSRRPGDKPRFIVDPDAGKKSLTDALSKVMMSLGASADVWMGAFDGAKHVLLPRVQDEAEPHDAETGEVRRPPARQHAGDGYQAPTAPRPAPPREGSAIQPAPPALANGRGWSVMLPGETKPFGPLPLQDAWAVLYRACKGEPDADGLNAAEMQEAKDMNQGLYDAVTPRAKAALDELLALRSSKVTR